MNEIRGKFIKKFDDYCGLIQVKKSNKGKNIFVVYGYFMDDSDGVRLIPGEIGDAIGKGSTELEAYIDAIKNLIEIRRDIEQSINNFLENCHLINYAPNGKKEKIVFEVSDYENKRRKFNATFHFNEKTNEVYQADI